MVQLISSLPLSPDVYDDLVADYFMEENQVRSHIIHFILFYADKTDRQGQAKGISQNI